MSRGYNNNNPGNIRHSKDKWQGMKAEQTDKSFIQFISMEYGYRAMIKILQTYQKKYGCRTIAEIINRYAPNDENDTQGYINAVCGDMGVKPNYLIDVDDRGQMILLVAAMSRVENGVKADMNTIQKAWEMI